jgi:hypothetical protein
MVVLDNSGSICGKALNVGHQLLIGIKDELEKNPNEVHMIGSDSYKVKQIFGQYDHTNTLTKWNCDGGSTFLWEYIFNTIQKYNTQSIQTMEVIIITDGYDNQSSDKFKGPNGYKEMMKQLDSSKKIPKAFRVFCIVKSDFSSSLNFVSRVFKAFCFKSVSADDSPEYIEKELREFAEIVYQSPTQKEYIKQNALKTLETKLSEEEKSDFTIQKTRNAFGIFLLLSNCFIISL